MNKKDLRVDEANKWLSVITSDKYKDVINNSKELSRYYTKGEVIELLRTEVTPMFDTTKVLTFKQDVCTSAAAAVTHADKTDRICVLCFASYYTPGGGFLKGSRAQEEDLCHISGLYPVLTDNFGYVYSERKDNQKNISSLYEDDCMYCKDVPIFKGSKMYTVDILVLAAPNVSGFFAKGKNSAEALRQRCEVAFRVPYSNGATKILLGAFGCGVFGNDVSTLIKIWNELRDKYNGCYKEIVHPILDAKTHRKFKKELKM